MASKKSEQISPKIKLNVKKDEIKTLQHFIEDIDEQLPVPLEHIQIDEHQVKKNAKPAFNNETSNGTKTVQDAIEKNPTNLENSTKESSHVMMAKLKTNDSGNDKKPAVKSPLESNGQLGAKSVNKTKEIEKKSIVSVSNPSKNESDINKQGLQSKY